MNSDRTSSPSTFTSASAFPIPSPTETAVEPMDRTQSRTPRAMTRDDIEGVQPPAMERIAPEEIGLPRSSASTVSDLSEAEQSLSPRPKYFAVRSDGTLTALVAVDELPTSLRIAGVPRTLSPGETTGMISVGIVPRANGYYNAAMELQSPSAHSQAITRRDSTTTSIYQGQQIHPQGNVERWVQETSPINPESTSLPPPTPSPSVQGEETMYRPINPAVLGGKIYCTHWVRTGECDFMQQGCIYRHEMPDAAMLATLGFRNIPRWFREAGGDLEAGTGNGAEGRWRQTGVGQGTNAGNIPVPIRGMDRKQWRPLQGAGRGGGGMHQDLGNIPAAGYQIRGDTRMWPPGQQFNQPWRQSGSSYPYPTPLSNQPPYPMPMSWQSQAPPTRPLNPYLNAKPGFIVPTSSDRPSHHPQRLIESSHVTPPTTSQPPLTAAPTLPSHSQPDRPRDLVAQSGSQYSSTAPSTRTTRSDMTMSIFAPTNQQQRFSPAIAAPNLGAERVANIRPLTPTPLRSVVPGGGGEWPLPPPSSQSQTQPQQPQQQPRLENPGNLFAAAPPAPPLVHRRRFQPNGIPQETSSQSQAQAQAQQGYTARMLLEEKIQEMRSS